jgi:hypothetical protein
MSEKSCPIRPGGPPALSGIEVVILQPEKKVKGYQEAVSLAKEQAELRFGEYMLVSWYDRDRDLESPPHATEKPGDGPKDGYIYYGLNHGARLKVDIEDGRFVFFFTPVEW